MAEKNPLLTVQNLSKSFGAVKALKDVSFDVYPGEVVALVGDNGAGKSTLIKAIAGVHPPTDGKIFINGEEVHFKRPADAREAGIETVYQHLALVEELDVADNVYLGREETRGGWLGWLVGLLDRARMRSETADALSQLHIKIPAPTMPVRSMSGGQRQAVAIGRAVTWGRKLLILDEPTAALREEHDLTFLIISHNMQDVYRIADRIIVLRQGEHVATLNRKETTPEEIVSYITGAKEAAHAHA
jgi:ABC-type sugar transport system ATPase subunit